MNLTISADFFVGSDIFFLQHAFILLLVS